MSLAELGDESGVDLHPIVRIGLADLICTQYPDAVITESSSVRLALMAIARHEPRLVVFDPWLKDGMRHRFQAAHAVRGRGDGTAYLAMGAHLRLTELGTYLRLGVAGYVDKEAPVEQVTDAIATVLAGRRYIDADLTLALPFIARDARFRHRYGRLTAREFRVMRRLGAAVSVPDIARELNLTEDTVRLLRTRVFIKMSWRKERELREFCAAAFGSP